MLPAIAAFLDLAKEFHPDREILVRLHQLFHSALIQKPVVLTSPGRKTNLLLHFQIYLY